ncbi:MAG: Dna2/Cas4 domain-containing protein [Coprococcus sp.]
MYSSAAKEVIGENAETGYVHTLKNNKRVAVPVDETSVKNAIGTIEWAVKGILKEDFPMRACSANCKKCDYRALCKAGEREPFKRKELPPRMSSTFVGERGLLRHLKREDGEF